VTWTDRTPSDAGGGGGFTSVWGSGAGDVYVTKYDGVPFYCARWTGSSWERVDTGPASFVFEPFDITGSGPDDVWILGQNLDTTDPYVLHWDGSTWERRAGLGDGIVAGTSDHGGGLWGISQRLDPVGLEEGTGGDIVRWSAASDWTVARPHEGPTAFGTTRDRVLAGVWASAADDAWAVGGQGELAHWDGVRWTTMSTGTTTDLGDVFGIGVELWAGTLHFDGRTWEMTHLFRPDGIPVGVATVWGRARDDLWGGGADYLGESFRRNLFHYDGETWTQLDSPGVQAIVDIEGGPSGEPWLIGLDDVNAGIIQRRSADGEWRTVRTESARLSELFVIADDDVWVVGTGPGLTGTGGHALHWNGSEWARDGESELAAARLSAIWASGPDDVWAVGGREIAHRDSAGWSVMTLPAEFDARVTGTLQAIRDVWGSGPDDVWIVYDREEHPVGTGSSAGLGHWDGRAWTPVASGSANALATIWARSRDDYVAVGDDGTVLRGRP
jgi:hypothetical protein